MSTMTYVWFVLVCSPRPPGVTRAMSWQRWPNSWWVVYTQQFVRACRAGLTLFPNPAQLSVACSTESREGFQSEKGQSFACCLINYMFNAWCVWQSPHFVLQMTKLGGAWEQATKGEYSSSRQSFKWVFQ